LLKYCKTSKTLEHADEQKLFLLYKVANFQTCVLFTGSRVKHCQMADCMTLNVIET